MITGASDPWLLRDLCSRAFSFLPAGVVIVAGSGEEGAPFGLTVSSLSFASFNPPMTSLAVSIEAQSARRILPGKTISLNGLAQGDKALARRFGGPETDRFAGGRWRMLPGLPPMLEGALFAATAEVHTVVRAGDHHLILARILSVCVHGGNPLVYWRHAMHPFAVEYPFVKSDAALDQFVREWEAGSLPRASWTHAAHVAVAAYYASGHPACQALQLTREGILRYNSATGTENTVKSGFHETLTRLWARIIGEFLRSHAFGSRLEAVRAAVEAFGEDRDRHRLYYSFDVVRDPKPAASGLNRIAHRLRSATQVYHAIVTATTMVPVEKYLSTALLTQQPEIALELSTLFN